MAAPRSPFCTASPLKWQVWPLYGLFRAARPQRPSLATHIFLENGKIFCRNAKNGKIFYNDVGPQRQSGLHINKPPTHRSQLRPKKNKNILKYSVCCQIRFKNLKNRPCGAQGHDAHSIHTIFGKIPTRKGHEIELSRRKSTPKHEFPHFFSSFFEEKKKGQKSHSQYTISRFRDTHSRRRKKSEHYKGTWAGLLTKHRGRCGLQRTLAYSIM